MKIVSTFSVKSYVNKYKPEFFKSRSRSGNKQVRHRCSAILCCQSYRNAALMSCFRQRPVQAYEFFFPSCQQQNLQKHLWASCQNVPIGSPIFNRGCLINGIVPQHFYSCFSHKSFLYPQSRVIAFCLIELNQKFTGYMRIIWPHRCEEPGLTNDDTGKVFGLFQFLLAAGYQHIQLGRSHHCLEFR